MNTELKAAGSSWQHEARPGASRRSSPAQVDPTGAWINGFQLYRFPLALAVVAVHSGQFVLARAAASPRAGGAGFGLWLVDFLTLICLPATSSFLVMAGFLLFRNGPLSLWEYRAKLRSRVRTLLLPYLAWNFLAILLFCAPAAVKFFMYRSESAPSSLMSFSSLASWFAGWPIYPANAPLWFVRDLLLLVVVAPLLSLIPRGAQVPGLVLLGLYWLGGPIDLLPGGIPRAFSTFFFSVGAWMGLNCISPTGRRIPGQALIIAAVGLILSAVLGASFGTPGTGHAAARSLFEIIARVSGTVLVICAATRPALVASFASRLRRLSKASFFVFGSHYCVLICLSAISSHLSPWRGSFSPGLLFFAALWSIALAVSLGTYFLLKRHAPSLLSVLDGGRTAGSGETSRGERPLPASRSLITAQPTPVLD